MTKKEKGKMKKHALSAAKRKMKNTFCMSRRFVAG